MKNWQTTLLIGLLAVTATILSGCSAQKGNSEADIRKAIEEHLASRPGLLSSDIVLDMKKVEVKGDQAEADVLFRSRTDPKASMPFHYQLHIDGKVWKVNESQPGATGSAPHPTPMQPPGDESPDGVPPSAQPLPQGHPPVEKK